MSRVLIHSVYRRRITGVAMLLSCFTMMIYSINLHATSSEDPLLWLAWIVLYGLFWFFIFLFVCLILTYFILKEDILSFLEEDEEEQEDTGITTNEPPMEKIARENMSG